MTDWILLAQGVNIYNTVLNTNDLSTIRGASLALEALGFELKNSKVLKDCAAKLLFYGGSYAAFRVNGLDRDAALALRAEVDRQIREGEIVTAVMEKPPQPEDPLGDADDVQPGTMPPTNHMTVMVDVQPIDGAETENVEAAIRVAMIRNRRRQMRSPDIPMPGSAVAADASLAARAALRCKIDPSQLLAQGAAPGSYSKRTTDLRTYGQDARRNIYNFQLNYSGDAFPGEDPIRKFRKRGLFDRFDFPQSFEQIHNTGRSDALRLLPAPLHQKLCFLTFDGTGFGSLRDDMGDTVEFSRMIRQANATALDALLEHFVDKAEADLSAADRSRIWTTFGEVKRRKAWVEAELLRVETLIFGGEDVALVTAPWLAFDLAKIMLKALYEGAQAALDGKHKVPTWRVGMLICDARTPARRASKVAHDLCEAAKPQDGKEAVGTGESPGGLNLHIAESYDLPEPSEVETMEVLRQPYQALGASDREIKNAFKFAGDEIAALVADVTWLKAALPRSQVYRMLQTPALDLEAELATIANRGRTEIDAVQILARLPAPDASPKLRLALLAELWDYIDPFNLGLSGGAA